MDAPPPLPISTPKDDDEVLHHIPPFGRIYKSGRVERFLGTAIVPAGHDPATAVSSKDVSLSPGVSARLFLPTSALEAGQSRRLPVLVYVHGGGFMIETAFSPTYTAYLNTLCSESGALAVSVDYRRAPEDPLPAAYDDSYAALQWVLSHSDPAGAADPWLAEHGDFEKVVLAGDSAGANIVHNMLLRHAEEESAGPIWKAVLIHPFFWGTTDVGPRSKEPQAMAGVEKNWKIMCPGTVGIDDPRVNPVAEAAAMARVRCEQVLVCVAGLDFLCEWGRAYYEALAGSGFGGRAEVVESEGEDHVFHLFKSGSAEALAFIRRLADFIRPGSGVGANL